MAYTKITAEQAGLTNYAPYLTHFQPLSFFCAKDGRKKTIFACPEGHEDAKYYIQCGSPEYINGWLYGAVQAACGQHRPLDPKESAAKLEGKTLALPDNMRIDFWMFEKYADLVHPLAFVWLPDLHENPNQALELLKWFENMYGNTNQNTSIWALEFELLARMLLHDHSLLVNPIHLDLSEVEDELLQMLNPEQAYLYQKARGIPQEKIQEMHDVHPAGFAVVRF